MKKCKYCPLRIFISFSYNTIYIINIYFMCTKPNIYINIFSRKNEFSHPASTEGKSVFILILDNINFSSMTLKFKFRNRDIFLLRSIFPISLTNTEYYFSILMN